MADVAQCPDFTACNCQVSPVRGRRRHSHPRV